MNERNRYLNPVTDICKDDGKVLIRLEMPGVEKVSARMENGVLHLELNVKEAVKPKKIAIS